MKTTLSDSRFTRSARVPLIAPLLFAGVLLPRVVMAGIQIEEAQREYQARYYFLTGQYCAWPACPCGVPAPAFPPNGFYDDLDKNQTLAVQLVRDLAGKFYPLALYQNFLKTPDGHAGIDGTSFDLNPWPAATFGPNDVSPNVAGADMRNSSTITEVNYHQCFQALRNYVTNCNYVVADWNLTNVANNVGNGWSTNNNDCGTAIGNAGASWAAHGWGDGSSWQPFQFTSSSLASNPPPATYWANKIGVREKLYDDFAHFPGFIQGTLLVYLACTIATNATAGLGATTPPFSNTNLVDRKFHLWQSPGVSAGTPYCSAYIGDGEPSIVGGCPSDVAATAGWNLLTSFLVLAPHFNTDPDDIHCSDGGCSAGSCSPNLPGSVTLGASGFNLRISMGLDA